MKSPHEIRLSAWLAGLLVCGLCGNAAAQAPSHDNWPQWRGPLATGVAPAANPPVTWSETSHIKWKVPIPGTGQASPIVWNNQVFIQTAINTGRKPADAPAAAPPLSARAMTHQPTEIYQFALLCLDRQTGGVLWQRIVRELLPHEGYYLAQGSFASASAVTDGERVIAFFGSRGVHCFDMAGNLQWEKELGRMEVHEGFGEGSSPALWENLVIITWDHKGDDFIVALDKRTGNEVWRQPRNENATWASPLPVVHEGRAQIVTPGTVKARSYDALTGKLLWEAGGLGDMAIPTAVAGNGLAYVMTGFRNSALLAVKLGRTGDLTDSDGIAWKLDRNTPYVASPLLYGNRLYLLKGRQAILSCYDATTGEPRYVEERLPGLNDVWASPVAAAGRVYHISRNGTAIVTRHSDQIEVLATNRLDDGDGFDASPALAGNQLFVRGPKHLYCIEE